jgi:peroxiredoxin
VAREKTVGWRWRSRASPLVVFSLIAVIAASAALLLPGLRLRSAPAVSFTLLDGRAVEFAQLRGRPVLIAFWATSCAPCVAELPDLVKLYRDLHPRGLELIAVAMPYDPPLHVQAFVRDHAVPYPVALDVGGVVWRAFDEVKFVPTTFLFDPQGEMIFRYVGKLDIARARRLVAPFLDQTPVTSPS